MLASNLLPKREDVGLRLVSSAGEALPAEIGERFKRHFGVDIVDGIGSTEMLHIFISNRPDKVRYGSTGWPVPGYEIELRGEDGRAVPDGEPGDLYIHGPSAALMYWGNRAKTRETFEGRWTRSGDKYIRNADGTFTYAGRSDDMLKVGGVWVSPFEVEATLVQHPSVLEAAVIGAPDADGLIKTKAFVVLKEGALGRRGGAQGLRQGSPRAVQVSALDRLHRRTAEDRDRQDPALQASRAAGTKGHAASTGSKVLALRQNHQVADRDMRRARQHEEKRVDDVVVRKPPCAATRRSISWGSVRPQARSAPFPARARRSAHCACDLPADAVNERLDGVFGGGIDGLPMDRLMARDRRSDERCRPSGGRSCPANCADGAKRSSIDVDDPIPLVGIAAATSPAT